MFGQFRCSDCGSTHAYRSRRRTFLEKYCFPLLLLRPVRCGNCFRRSSASVLVSARKREEGIQVERRAA